MQFEALRLDSLFNTFNLFDNTNGTWTHLLFRLIFAIVFGLFLSFIYYRVLHENGKSQRSLIQSLVLLPLATAAVTVIIGNSLARAFGLLGAVSVIRFRTDIKNAADMAFIFMAIVLGMSCGSSMIPIGIVSLIIFAVTVIALEYSKYGKKGKEKRDYLLTVKSSDPAAANEKIRKELFDNTGAFRLQEMEFNDSGTLSYKFVLLKSASEQDLLNRLSNMKVKGIGEIKLKRQE